MEDNIPEIENEVPVEEIQAPEVEIGAEEKPVTLRDQLLSARDKTQEPTEKSERQRSEDGKFAKKIETPKKLKEPIVDKPLPEAVKPIEVPQSYSPVMKEKFKTLPSDVQQELIKRETDYHKELTRHDEERQAGRQFNKIVTPYVAQMRAEGAQPLQAVESLLNTAYLLRFGNPVQKRQLLLDTARQFGVDLSQAQQQSQRVDPVLQQVLTQQQELARLVQQGVIERKQSEDAQVNNSIEAFKVSPGHEHFETVKPYMAALLGNKGPDGQPMPLAKDLQDAYDQAINAHPNIRSTLQQQQSVDAESKRVAEAKAKALAAKKAGSSIRGGPGMVAQKNGQIASGSLNDMLRTAYRGTVDG